MDFRISMIANIMILKMCLQYQNFHKKWSEGTESYKGPLLTLGAHAQRGLL